MHSQYPVYPSALLSIDASRYFSAVDLLCDTPGVFLDGETIVVPEASGAVIDMLIKAFDAIVIERGWGAEYELATRVAAAGCPRDLVALAYSAQALALAPIDELLQLALTEPDRARRQWRDAYAASFGVSDTEVTCW